MTALVFADNTVLVAFGYLDRFDILEAVAKVNGRWTLAVASECAKSAAITGLESLRRAQTVFGEPIVPTPAERVEADALRAAMASPGDPRTKHLGEAESIAVILSRGDRAYFVTDDQGALDATARAGIPTVTTGELLKLAVRIGVMTAQEAWDSVQKLRHVPHHVARTPLGRHDFMNWLVS